MIKLVVSAANITVEEKETLTEGRVGLLCQFRFTDEWSGLSKTAVFDGADSRDVILKSDTVAIPAECLTSEGYSLSVGVYGKNAAGDIVIPTVYATVGKIQRSAYPSGKEPAAPTPDVVSQIQQAAANAEALARSVREDADLGKFDGDKGEKGDPGPAGDAGGWYTPAVTQPDANTMRFAFTPSKEGMPAVVETDVTLPSSGGSGGSGADGKSAYAYAQEGGFTGTEAEFIAKLAAEKFANPNALTFTGAVSGSYDGSEAVTVEIPSGGGSASGGADWQLILDATIPAGVTVHQDALPKAMNNYKELFFEFYVAATSATINLCSGHVTAASGTNRMGYQLSGTNRLCGFYIKKISDMALMTDGATGGFNFTNICWYSGQTRMLREMPVTENFTVLISVETTNEQYLRVYGVE